MRSRNKDICKLNSRVHYLKRRINEVEDVNVRTRMVEELHEKQKLILTMPSGNDMDVNFRRLKYVRYADDFLIGVIGTKNECEKIKADITKFYAGKVKAGDVTGKDFDNKCTRQRKIFGLRNICP